MRSNWLFLVAGICLVVVLCSISPEAYAQLAGGGGPMGSVVTKTNEARDIVVTVGKAAVGLVAAVLFAMALAGKVAWHWVIMVVIAGAGFTGLDAIVSWING